MYRVLLVEDEEIIRKGIRYSVPWEEYGCTVIGEAENGEIGEEKIAELRPDIVTYDLHTSEWNDGNVMTEYEEKFSRRGNPINKLIAVRK